MSSQIITLITLSALISKKANKAAKAKVQSHGYHCAIEIMMDESINTTFTIENIGLVERDR